MSSEPEVVYNNTYENPAIRTQNFDSNWKYYRGDAGAAEGKEFDDPKWESISIPHDYSITQQHWMQRVDICQAVPDGIESILLWEKKWRGRNSG